MPKVVINGRKGLVQSSGSGTLINSGLALGNVQTIAVPAAAAAGASVAGTVNQISTDATIVILNQTNDANDRVYLPDPASLPEGKVYILIIGGGVVELCTEGKNISFNDTATVTHAGTGAAVLELALVDETVNLCIRESSSKWRIVTLADAGAADAV